MPRVHFLLLGLLLVTVGVPTTCGCSSPPEKRFADDANSIMRDLRTDDEARVFLAGEQEAEIDVIETNSRIDPLLGKLSFSASDPDVGVRSFEEWSGWYATLPFKLSQETVERLSNARKEELPSGRVRYDLTFHQAGGRWKLKDFKTTTETMAGTWHGGEGIPQIDDRLKALKQAP